MTTPTVTAAALALLLATVPAAGQPIDADVPDPAPTTATDIVPITPAAPDDVTAVGAGSTASSTTDTGTPDTSSPAVDEAPAEETETGSGPSTEVGVSGADVAEDATEEGTGTETTPGAVVTDESTTTDEAVDDATGGASDLEELAGGDELAGSADPAEAVTAPVEPAAESADGEVAEQADVTPRLVVAPGYQEDGYDRPFWWAEDGLHFRDPIPANGYVNINVPGADNVSIDSHRELIGQTFIPWSYFNLQPGMCISWTESNGFSYHFGEDNSGRGGVDEKDWEFCVPGSTDPDEPVVPDPDEPDQPDVPDPDEPDVPDVPEDPDVPDQPDEPDTPSTPDTPDVPDQPQTPAEPVTPAGPDAPTEVPESTLPVVEVPLSTAGESVPAGDTTTTAATEAETATPGALAVTGLGAGAKSLLAAAAALGIGGGLMALASKTKQR